MKLSEKIIQLRKVNNWSQEDLAEKILSEEAVEISIELQDGNGTGKAWGCDLTYDYVKINGDYRT